MSISLYTKVKSKIPKKSKFVNKGIFANQMYSDNIYGIYTKYPYILYTQELNLYTVVDIEPNNLNLYSKIIDLKSNQLDIYSNVTNIKSNQLDIYSTITNFDFSLGIYSYIEETSINNNNLSLVSNVSAVNQNDLFLYTKITCADFKILVYNKDTNLLLTNINWVLYKRDPNISLYGLVDINHTVVSSGLSLDGIINIFLNDYNLENFDNDYYIKVWKNTDIYHELNIQISYYYENYINTRKCPYFLLKTYLKKEGDGTSTKEKIIYSGIGGIGGVTPIEICVSSTLITTQSVNTICDLKEDIKVKSKLIFIKENKKDQIEITFEGVKYV